MLQGNSLVFLMLKTAGGKKIDFQMCKCIAGYSIQRQWSQVTPKMHFCFHLLMVMGVRPQ